MTTPAPMWGGDEERELQLDKLRPLLDDVLTSNDFYRRKLNAAGLADGSSVKSWEEYVQLPFTTKEELSRDQADTPPYGTNLTYLRGEYIRIHQTSGTTGQRLRWLDTADSWAWWGECWQAVYRGAGVTGVDRIFFAFSFGPFIGFWSAYEGATQLGAMAIAGGGMSTRQRLDAIVANEATVLVCTPTYALHLAEVAVAEGIDLPASAMRATIHAGEPGAGLPATKSRIEASWGAHCFDHAGATEVGAWGFECAARNGLHVNEAEFICEILDPDTLEPATEGELVVTNLGRTGMPVIRYRTGDRVCWSHAPCECGRTFRKLDGGVIGRLDDGLLIRGMNIYPSAIENALRQFPEIGEFAVDVYRPQSLDQLQVRFEVTADNGTDGDLTPRVKAALQNQLGVRVGAEVAPSGSLPRFELKARRVTDHR